MEITKDMIFDLINEMTTAYHQCLYYGNRQMNIAQGLFCSALIVFVYDLISPASWLCLTGWVIWGIGAIFATNGIAAVKLHVWFHNSSCRLKALWDDYEDDVQYKTESVYDMYHSDMAKYIKKLDRHCWFMTKREDREVQRRAVKTMCALFNMKEDEWELPKQ